MGRRDILIGGAGLDRLWGGKGDDTFFVDPGDGIAEQPDEGSDWVVASLGYSLGDHIATISNKTKLYYHDLFVI